MGETANNKSFWSSLWEIFQVVLVSFVTVFLIRHFIVQPFLVSGASMEPNFSGSNYLLVDEVTYQLRQPQRGEVVVFRYPNDPSTFFIKRIIGLPNDRVVVQNGKVTVYHDGSALQLSESYLAHGTNTSGNIDTHLGADEYFVMGDNRSFSFDSRNWGPVKKNLIIGLVRFRLFPLNEIQFYEWQPST